MARVHLINHLDKWHSGQNKVQNESHCDLVSTNLWYSAMEMFVTWDKQREPPGTKHIFTTEGAPRERLQWAQQSCRVFSELSRISLMLSFANSAVLFFSFFFFFSFAISDAQNAVIFLQAAGSPRSLSPHSKVWCFLTLILRSCMEGPLQKSATLHLHGF